MSARVARLRISTVAPRPSPASKGIGRPLGTPLTVLGDTNLRGGTAAGLEPAESWLVVVELENSDGIVGTGTAGFGNPATIPVIRQLEPTVIGRSAGEPAELWERMYRSTLNIGRRGVVMHAISAIDIALWDLRARELGVPVYALLGGAMRPRVPVYASWLYATEDIAALAAEAAEWAAQGFLR